MFGSRKLCYDTTKNVKVDGKHCIYIHKTTKFIYYVTLRFPRDLVAMLISGCKVRRQRSPDQSNATKFHSALAQSYSESCAELMLVDSNVRERNLSALGNSNLVALK